MHRVTSDQHICEYPLYLYEFGYRDERTGTWRTARHPAEVDQIRKRHAEFQIDGEPMVIDRPSLGTFNPFRHGAQQGSRRQMGARMVVNRSSGN